MENQEREYRTEEAVEHLRELPTVFPEQVNSIKDKIIMDKKLEEAAQNYARRLFPDWETNVANAFPYVTAEMGFKAGSRSQAQQNQEEAILSWEEWKYKRDVYPHATPQYWVLDNCPISTTQLYAKFKEETQNNGE